jgi:hypothetical protein
MDTQSTQQALVAAVSRLLRPLVRIMLRNGISVGSFSEILRRVFVEVALEDFAPEGKKQTFSRVSALTGLSRKEVKRLVEDPSTDAEHTEQRYNRATRVIGGWLNDTRFSLRNQPATLFLDERNPSFNDLVKDYSGDIPPKAMLSTLQGAGNVEVDGDQVRLIKRAYIPGNDAIEKLNILGSDVAELIDTINYNLTHDSDLRFQRKTSNNAVRAADLSEYRALMREKSQALLEELDAWLSAHEANNDKEDKRYVSTGIYFHEDSPHRGGDSND